LKYKEIKAGI